MANFDANMQFVFTNTTATALGLPQNDVQISSIKNATTALHVVRLLASGVIVNYIIIVPPSGSGSSGNIINVTTIQSTVSSPTFTQTFVSNLQTYALANNITSLKTLLASVNITLSSAIVTPLSDAPTLAPAGSSGSSSKNTDTLVIETVVPIVGFFVLAGIAYGVYYFYHTRKQQVAEVYES